MKRVLVTGAAGMLGRQLLKYLLAEGKYEVTALDLKNKGVYHALKRYRKRVDIVYADVLDTNLVEKLVKNTDVVIHLASCLPPVCNYYGDISKIIEEDGTENIVKAISYYNPKCYLIYGSTTSLYTNNEASVKDSIDTNLLDNFSKAKYNSEKLIVDSIKNYTILRFPLILGDFTTDNFIYNINPTENVEMVTKEDASESIIECINKYPNANKKILNIGGGESLRDNYGNLVNRILKTHGISNKFIAGYLMSERNYRSPYLTDTDKSNELLSYQNDSLKSYFKRQEYRSRKRRLRKLIGGLFISKKRVK